MRYRSFSGPSACPIFLVQAVAHFLHGCIGRGDDQNAFAFHEFGPVQTRPAQAAPKSSQDATSFGPRSNWPRAPCGAWSARGTNSTVILAGRSGGECPARPRGATGPAGGRFRAASGGSCPVRRSVIGPSKRDSARSRAPIPAEAKLQNILHDLGIGHLCRLRLRRAEQRLRAERAGLQAPCRARVPATGTGRTARQHASDKGKSAFHAGRTYLMKGSTGRPVIQLRAGVEILRCPVDRGRPRASASV